MTVADLLHSLGDIPPRRILWNPRPGTATEKDVTSERERTRRLCELVDGTLVEKAMAYRDSFIAGFILHRFHVFNQGRNLGIPTGADGMVRLFPGLVRIPDVAFALWRNVPGGRMPTDPIPHLIPNLVVEVLSEGNTSAEMERKRDEYLKAGAELIWMVDPEPREITIYAGAQQPQILRGDGILTGGTVLAGFWVTVGEILAGLDRVQP
jgi:Uma2 family endonuclease